MVFDRRTALALLAACLAGCAARSSTTAPEIEVQRHLDDRPWIREKLASMAAADQDARNHDQPFEALDQAHTRILKGLLTRHRWFTIDAFGREADEHAWLLVQHADLNPEFQARVLATLESLPPGQTNPQNVAYLHDRVACASVPCTQRFGTQGHCVGKNRWEPFPIEQPQQVDARRKAVGMEPMAAYQQMFVGVCK